MRVAALIIASCILAVSGVGVASAQFIDPLRVLEESRRDRLELDKRLAREAAARRQKERVDQAAQAKAQRKLDEAKATAATGAPTPDAPPAQFETSSAGEIGPGAPVPAASSAASAARGTPDQNQIGAAPAQDMVDRVAPSPSSAIDMAGGTPLSDKTAAPPIHEGAPGAAKPTASAAGAANESPAASHPVTPSLGGVVETSIAPPTRVLITVDKAAQRMRVIVDGKLRHFWPVSTGRAHYETPTGTFRPLYLAKVHYSKEWDDAPMPHSIFFTDRGHAIHGSNATRSLGRPASHGCVRLAPSKAAALFALVQAEGQGMTKLIITGGAAVKAMQNSLRSRTGGPRARETAQVQ